VTSCGSLKFELPSRIQTRSPSGHRYEPPAERRRRRGRGWGRPYRSRSLLPLAVGDAAIDEMEADPRGRSSTRPAWGVLAPPDGPEHPIPTQRAEV